MSERQAYRSILVPLDGSVFAEHVLPAALAIARGSGAALRVARVHAGALQPGRGPGRTRGPSRQEGGTRVPQGTRQTID